MTFWNKLKQLFTGKSLSTQFEEILLKDETPPTQIAEVEAETVKEEPMAKKKTVAKPADKATKSAAKPAAKGKKKINIAALSQLDYVVNT